MLKKHKNSGFTLVELIVAMVISGIVLSLVGHFFISFTKTSRQSKASQLRVYEQNVVVRCFEKFENLANLNGASISLDNENKTLSFNISRDEVNNAIIKYDKTKKVLTYNTLNYSLDKVIDINISQDETRKTLFNCELTFDNETVYRFSIYIINQESI